MSLLWWFAEQPLSFVLGLIPEPPEPIDIVFPWPAWIPVTVFLLGVVAVLAAGSLFLLLKFVRWVYGLIPVVQ